MKTSKKLKKENMSFDLDDELMNQLKDLQNEINSRCETGKIAITSISEDLLSFKFAIALAKSYNNFDSKALIIDANFYSFSTESGKKAINDIDGVDVLRLKDENYPGDYFRSAKFKDLIEKHKKNYEHIIVLMPDIKKHKEIGILEGFFDCAILVSRRNKTRKEDVFSAIEYCKEKQLPIAKVVILK